MGTGVARRIGLTGVGTALCVAAWAQGLPSTLEEALQLAQQQFKGGTTREYDRGPFKAYLEARYVAIVEGCMRTHPLGERMVYVLALDAEGNVARVYANQDSPTMRCVEDPLSRDRFPRPPVAPYFAAFRFELPPK